VQNTDHAPTWILFTADLAEGIMEMMPCDALSNTARRGQQRISNPLELVIDALEVFSLLLDKDNEQQYILCPWMASAGTG